MPQQPVTLELTATLNDKTFPIGSFTINIPINFTHNEVNTYKAGDTYTTLIRPKPPSTDELITRFTNAIKAFKTTFETNPDEVGAVKS
ncbi:hypothetical protein [Bifidobacterium breve]|uniref:Uncharacterized protein n=1 Tax=Bifidobacterium breve TaxID=1685 RepID=A0A2K9B2S2_BIFBR|nr:hypothetical protein [Bifidobacterium breve]AUE03562.1 hypothetical protein BB215W447A_1554 [Bifidobacterium breve]AUE05602.1 hypothetical protein CNCMI4321_1391 [Bifidobacterium breve]AUE21025.1 hypothetical protein DRBB30_1389 [Bifidobacterium breve]